MGPVAHLGEEIRVVTSVACPPPLGLADLIEAFLAVLADRLQQPVAGLRPVFLGHHQRPCHQGRQQLEYRAGIDPVRTADRLDRRQAGTAREHRQPGQQLLFGFGEQLKGPVDSGPQRLLTCYRPAAACSARWAASANTPVLAAMMWRAA